MSLDVDLYIEIDTGGKEKRRVTLYEGNITHNLNEMAEEAGIYNVLWHPENVGAKFASDIIIDLENGLVLMEKDPERFEAFNSPNGWGMYEHFVPFVREYLKACKENPKALIYVSI